MKVKVWAIVLLPNNEHHIRGGYLMEYSFRNLVFEGGGAKGAAYAGALEFLKEKKIQEVCVATIIRMVEF